MSNRKVSLVARPAAEVAGRLRVPGDKSISHRSLMFGALADGVTRVNGFLPGEDCLATMAALDAMGVTIERTGDTSLRIEGRGLRGLSAPVGSLDMGNSGTAMRLFAGLLAGQSFDSTLSGDASLTQRPMERIAAPLRLMGADIVTRDGKPPLAIRGGQSLRGIDYAMPVASAQVKSAVLLAGLYADGSTSVVEPAVTRDHTERMLSMFGQRVLRDGARVTLQPRGALVATDVDVPADLSSAAFFMLAGTLARSGELTLDNVGLNPTRTGILRILELMGADLDIRMRRPDEDGEPTGTIVIRPARLRGIEVPTEFVPLAIDEFPLVFVAAALADGDTVIAGAEELRHKESDRIGVMVNGLRALGATVDERPDGAIISGGGLSAGEIDSAGDHRVAMAFAIAAMAADGPVIIQDAANVATSFPGFDAAARQIGLDVSEVTDGDD
ncbi:MAG: 3-phosphoshikimate 1-carboxyvinyltransferase [Gammaproteobacteria bacterium]|nr:3-phosphoshikimate 1-carboxyvinyltransferase [Gammaproteobacteria bacterium]